MVSICIFSLSLTPSTAVWSSQGEGIILLTDLEVGWDGVASKNAVAKTNQPPVRLWIAHREPQFIDTPLVKLAI
jgi:hypothetical protein